jgi:hypothetical protein
LILPAGAGGGRKLRLLHGTKSATAAKEIFQARRTPANLAKFLTYKTGNPDFYG